MYIQNYDSKGILISITDCVHYDYKIEQSIYNFKKEQQIFLIRHKHKPYILVLLFKLGRK